MMATALGGMGWDAYARVGASKNGTTDGTQ